MKKRNILVLVLISLMLATNGFCISINSLISKAKITQDQYNSSVKDITIIEETTVSTQGQKMVIKRKTMRKGKKFRMEPIDPQQEGMKTIILFDGQDAWMISPMTGKMKTPREDNQAYDRDKIWDDLKRLNAKVTGTEKVNSRKCYVISLNDENSKTSMTTWIDQKNYQTVKQISKSGKDEYIIIFSDFRKVKGKWEHPHKTQIYENKNLVSSTTIKSIKINQGLSDSLFNASYVARKNNISKPAMNDDMMKMLQKMMQEQQ